MRRILTLLIFLSPLLSGAVVKTWTGAGMDNKWGTGTNWSGSTPPAQNDDIIFNFSDSVYLNVVLPLSPAGFRSLTIVAGSTVTFASSASRVIEVYTSAYGLSIEAGATLNLSGTNSLKINVQSLGGTALINGTLNCKAPSSELKGDGGAFAPVFTCNGTIKFFSGSGNISGFASTSVFNAGSVLDIGKDGGTIPSVQFKDGSLLKITGTVASGPVFSSSAKHDGVIEWNAPSQTAVGANILPTTSFTGIDSIRIINTGSGSARLNTNPSGAKVGHIEVQGGTLAIGSPGTTIAAADTIATDLKISGGTLIGNMTTPGEITALPLTLIVNGNVSITGGSLIFSNRPTTLSSSPTTGAFALSVKGNLTQSGGSITTTTRFGSMNELSMTGTSLQSLSINNMTDTIAFVVSNSNGVSLQNDLNLPYSLSLSKGYLQLNNYNTTVSAALLLHNATFYPVPKVVTNGTGLFKLTSLSAAKTVPIAPTSGTYNPLFISNGQGLDYRCSVEVGISPTITDGPRAINRTWSIIPSATPAGLVGLGFQYTGSTDKNVNCIPSADMEVGDRADDIAWAVIASPMTPTVPSGADTFKVATVNTNLFRNDGPATKFVVANLNAILPVQAAPALHYRHQSNRDRITLYWEAAANTSASFMLERSADGRRFTAFGQQAASMGRSDYEQSDVSLNSGINYFRLKTVDVAGRSTYSNTVSIRSSNSDQLIVAAYPTLVHERLTVSFDAIEATDAELQIVDNNGKRILQRAIRLSTGTSVSQLGLTNMAAGVYTLQVWSNGELIRSIRFVKD